MTQELLVEVSSAFEESDLQELPALAALVGSELRVRQRPDGGPFNAFEWAIPAAIAIGIALKPFTDNFLKQLGTAAGKKAVNALGALFGTSKKKESRVYTSAELKRLTAGGIDKETFENLKKEIGRPIAPLEIRVRGDDGRHRIRLVFPYEMSADTFNAALEKLSLAKDAMFEDESEDQAHRTTTFVFVPKLMQWQSLEQLIREKAQASKSRDKKS